MDDNDNAKARRELETYQRAMQRVRAAKRAADEAANPPPPVPCPERGCAGVGIVSKYGPAPRRFRCSVCGCDFAEGDTPAAVVDAEAAEIFAANILKKESGEFQGTNRDALVDGMSLAESRQQRRMDGAARHVYRSDRRRRGSGLDQIS